MRVSRIEDAPGGWFVGDDGWSVLRTRGARVAVMEFPAGFDEPPHTHRRHSEVTVMLSGRAIMQDRTVAPGDVIVLEPGESCGFTVLEDVCCVVVKAPVVEDDKHVDAAGSQPSPAPG